MHLNYKKCYELRCEVLGENHPDTLYSDYFLALADERLKK